MFIIKLRHLRHKYKVRAFVSVQDNVVDIHFTLRFYLCYVILYITKVNLSYILKCNDIKETSLIEIV